jgi:hypothetical protein
LANPHIGAMPPKPYLKLPKIIAARRSLVGTKGGAERKRT